MDPSEDHEIARLTRSELSGETERAVQSLLKTAFGGDDRADYYEFDIPERVILMSSGGRLVGHLAAYIRDVALGDEELAIGLIGGVAVEAEFRSQGHAKRLLKEAHVFFDARSLPFSVLFAYEPARYRSSGYRPMTNETRFSRAAGGSSSSIVAEWRRIERAKMARHTARPARPRGLIRMGSRVGEVQSFGGKLAHGHLPARRQEAGHSQRPATSPRKRR